MRVFNIDKYKSEKASAINMILEVYKSELFGAPPKVDTSGKLYGAQPPNMKLLEKLLF